MTKLHRLLALAFAAALAGCAQNGSISRDFQNPGYDPQLVQFMANTGQVPVVLRGNPFADSSWLEQLSLPGFYPQAPFAAVPAADREDGHLVFLFDAPIGVDGQKACRAPGEVPSEPAGTSLRLQSAFCYASDELSEAHLEMARPASPTDPAFEQAMARLISRLVPTISPNAGGCPDGEC